MKFSYKYLCVIFILTITLSALCFQACDNQIIYADDLEYEYTLDQTVTPYWYNITGRETIVYNEIVVPIQYNNANEAIGFLTYTPSQIISVRDYTLKTEFSAEDYSVDGNKISVKTDSSMPYMKAEWLDNKNVPDKYLDSVIATQYNDKGGTNNGTHVICEGAMTRTNFLAVTYAYDNKLNKLGFDAAQYTPENYPNLLKKLKAGSPVKILIFGDSISVGASASSMMQFEPYLPTWFDLIKDKLAADFYDGNEDMITIVNPSVGGTQSQWGIEQVQNNAFDMTDYDLVIIGFGMNDGYEGYNISGRTFANKIEKILQGIKKYSPTADYVILSSFTPNPKSIFAGNHSKYVEKLQLLADEYNSASSGCTHVDMYSLSTAILSAKQKNNTSDTRYQYMDISANYTNHPNDYMVRLYAGNILSTFIDFAAV